MKEEIKERLEKIKQAEIIIAQQKQLLPLVESKEKGLGENFDEPRMYLELLGTGSIEMNFDNVTSRISLEDLKSFYSLIEKFLKEVGGEK